MVIHIANLRTTRLSMNINLRCRWGHLYIVDSTSFAMEVCASASFSSTRWSGTWERLMMAMPLWMVESGGTQLRGSSISRIASWRISCIVDSCGISMSRRPNGLCSSAWMLKTDTCVRECKKECDCVRRSGREHRGG